MENVLENIKPVEVFKYFREISKIPRGSGNEKGVSDYLVSFAKEHKLDYIQDKALNVIIKKPGTKGYENSQGVVIQGHMDMVCEKKPGVDHDFTKDPIELRVVDDMLYATGTTLGGDDGISIAMGLAILASDEIDHPPIELVVTTSEETGMDGAIALDPKAVSGRTLINIDSEEEGILTVSCAGGCTSRISIPITWESAKENTTAFSVEIKGLNGGHSGIEINKGRANSNKLMGRLLKNLSSVLSFNLNSISGGSKHNAIPREAQAVICVSKNDESLLKNKISDIERAFKGEFKTADPNLQISLKTAEAMPEMVMTEETTNNVVNFLFLIPNGIQTMSMDIPNLVESSLNLGVVLTNKNSVEFISSIRSSVRSLKENIYNSIVALGNLTNATVTEESGYPEWQYNSDSKIRDTFIKVYEKLFGKKPEVAAIHAGLECALFAEKFNGEIDMVSIGPSMFGVHTANEHLSIPSTQRTWQLLLEVLKTLK